ncbi:MAG TPA: DUF1439 domain-containing protein [Anaerolineae bacterium]|nr:DUF1439 domain-containing protein [Anaerolineae bacterium]
MKRLVGWLLLVSLLLVGCGQELSVTVPVPGEVVQQQLNGQFPISARAIEPSLPFDVIISNPELILAEGNDKLGIRMAIDVVLLQDIAMDIPAEGVYGFSRDDIAALLVAGQQTAGSVTLFGSLRYDATQKSIYVENVEVTELDFSLLPPEVATSLSEFLGPLMSAQLATMPIVLPQDDKMVAVTTAALKSITIKNGQLLVKFGL